jgi:hypothetical protein
MSASEENEKRTLMIAFDGEMTGQFMKKKDEAEGTDVMFAIGWAASSRIRNNAPMKDRKPSDVAWEEWWNQNGVGMIAIDLKKPADKSWEEWWQQNGWEMDCFKFWGRNIDKLEMMQDPEQVKLVADKHEMMHVLNAALIRLEEDYDEIIPLCDTLFFDSVWMSTYMMEAGLESMMYRRDDSTKGFARMMWGREVSTYVRGVYNLQPNDSTGAIKKKLMKRVPDFDPDDAHLPDSDAIGILAVMEESMKVANRKRQKCEIDRAAKRQKKLLK